MKARELIKELTSGGAVLARKTGDHHLFRFPSGAVIAVPVGGKQNEAPTHIVKSVRRALRKERGRAA